MTEDEIARRFVARANPPPILFRYRSPTDRTLDEISKQQIYAAKPDQLNDPFECSAPVYWNVELIRQEFIEKIAPKFGLSSITAAKEFDLSLEGGLAKLRDGIAQSRVQTGIICLSAIPNSIRMWSYYAQSHEGICIGFKTKERPFNVALKVKYQNPDAPLDAIATLKGDPTEIASHISLRKAEEWEFEQEYRIPIAIGDSPRLIPFQPSAIAEIRFGAQINVEFKEKVMEAISHLPHRPAIMQMGCDFSRFTLTESLI